MIWMDFSEKMTCHLIPEDKKTVVGRAYLAGEIMNDTF